MPELFLVDRSFNRCRKEKREEGHCKIAKNILENRTDLAKTAVHPERLDNGGNMKAEITGSHIAKSSVRKQASTFATVQKRKPRSRSPSVKNEKNGHSNSIQNHDRIAESPRASC